MNIITCIGCGCDDERACVGKCSWIRIDAVLGIGVCSSCPEDVARWDAGDRLFTEEAEQELRREFTDEAPPDDEPGLIVPGDFAYDETLRYLRSR